MLKDYNKEPNMKSPSPLNSPNSPNSPNDINNSYFKRNQYELSRSDTARNSFYNVDIKPFSKKEVANDIQNIKKQYNDLDKITSNINEQYEINSNKMDAIVNETMEISNILNEDLFIRLKVYEDNKQNKTYYKRNIASEIGFITLDYLLTSNVIIINKLFFFFFFFFYFLF